jgi:hypothetical protein
MPSYKTNKRNQCLILLKTILKNQKANPLIIKHIESIRNEQFLFLFCKTSILLWYVHIYAKKLVPVFFVKIACYYLDGKEDRSVGECAGTLRPDQSYSTKNSLLCRLKNLRSLRKSSPSVHRIRFPSTFTTVRDRKTTE